MKNKNIYIILLIIILLFLFVYLFNKHAQQKKIDDIITIGLNYIHDNQLTTGELPSLFCAEKDPGSCIDGNNIFVTSSALYSLIEVNKIINDAKVSEVIGRSFAFLYKQKNQNDLWQYWIKNHTETLNPDLDDTSITSFLIEKYSNKQLNNLNYFESNKLFDGTYYTWVPDHQGKNNVDISVNSNILLYLNHKNKDTGGVCGYLNSIIENNREKEELYTQNTNILYYNYSKAYQSGADCLSKSKNKIIEKIASSQEANGSIENSVLSTSLAVLALQNFGEYNNNFIKPAINYITNNFAGDHFSCDFYFSASPNKTRYLGKSDVYSTTLAIEAIIRSARESI